MMRVLSCLPARGSLEKINSGQHAAKALSWEIRRRLALL
jgi:hypothetical protein